MAKGCLWQETGRFGVCARVGCLTLYALWLHPILMNFVDVRTSSSHRPSAFRGVTPNQYLPAVGVALSEPLPNLKSPSHYPIKPLLSVQFLEILQSFWMTSRWFLLEKTI